MFDDRCPNPFTGPLGRLHGAGRGRPRGRMRAVRARSGAVADARRHPGDGAFAAAHRPAGDPRRLARRKAAHRRRPLPRSVLGRGARRWSPARLTRVREQVRRHRDLRRLLRLVVGRAAAPRAQPGAALPVPRRRLRRPGRQLQLRRGDVPAAARDRHLPAGDRPGDRLAVDRQAHAADHRVRRACDSRTARSRRAAPACTRWRRGSRRAKAAGIEFVVGQPAAVGCARFPRRPMGADPAEHRHRADAGDGAHAAERGAPRRAIHGALLRGLRAVPPLSPGLDDGAPKDADWAAGDHRRCRRHASATSRAAPPRPAA